MSYNCKMKRIPIPQIDTDFFMARCNVDPDTGCWVWQRSHHMQKGYGNFRWKKRTHSAHRESYRAHNGPIPDGMVVMHSCDNPACCNPAHLLLGTQADNLKDMRDKGRQARGEASRSVLTNADVMAIRQSRLPHRDLAASLGCDEETVRLARTGQTWPHLPGAWVKKNNRWRHPDDPPLRGRVPRLGVSGGKVWP